MYVLLVVKLPLATHLEVGRPHWFVLGARRLLEHSSVHWPGRVYVLVSGKVVAELGSQCAMEGEHLMHPLLS